MKTTKKPAKKPIKRKGPPPWEHEVDETRKCVTDAGVFGIQDAEFNVRPRTQLALLNDGKMGVFATGADGGYRFKITTEKLTAEEKRSVSGRAHMGFLTTSGKIVIDSGTEQSKPFVMPIGYATCSVFGMSAEAREKNKRLPDYVMRVRWVSKDYRFTGDYNDYPTVD